MRDGEDADEDCARDEVDQRLLLQGTARTGERVVDEGGEVVCTHKHGREGQGTGGGQGEG